MANQIITQNDSNDSNDENNVEKKELLVADNSKEINNVYKDNLKKKIKITSIIFMTILLIAIILITVFSYINYRDDKIKKGVLIEGIDVSGLTMDEAKNKIQTDFLDTLDNTIYLQYGDSVYSIALEQIDVNYDLDTAVKTAHDVGRIGSFINRDIKVLSLGKNSENISIKVNLDEIALDACIVDISAKLPDQVEQPSYYIDGSDLIITSGKIGKAASNEETKNIVIDALNQKNFKDVYYDIPVYDRYPDEIDVDKIYNEVYRDVKDAYFTTEPRMVYPDETGIDFAESIDTVKEQIKSESKSEYVVPLKYTRANITVNDLGQEAFPDQLASSSTTYVNNANRTTNLRLAANKINGTVIMPGETFSYNTIVGERTIAAGYKNAAIYENGQVVDGLGGGICQVSSTLYNSVLKSNLEIVERTNHMFLTTYSPGGLDATVAYGSLDFKFKNNRSYPIKVVAGIDRGYCTVQIYGLSTPDDYQIQIYSRKIGARTYQAYKSYYKDGQLINTELISTDTYSTHN